jgi:predicted enzyme related to lactoylglutathione lyase
MSHPVVRWQIVSPDPDTTLRFYRQLFRWDVDQANALGYSEVRPGGNGIAGGVWPAPATAGPFVQLFVAVPDVAQYVERAATLGATVLVPTSVLPDGDSMAVLRDPLGLPFGICTLRRS